MHDELDYYEVPYTSITHEREVRRTRKARKIDSWKERQRMGRGVRVLVEGYRSFVRVFIGMPAIG